MRRDANPDDPEAGLPPGRLHATPAEQQPRHLPVLPHTPRHLPAAGGGAVLRHLLPAVPLQRHQVPGLADCPSGAAAEGGVGRLADRSRQEAGHHVCR